MIMDGHAMVEIVQVDAEEESQVIVKLQEFLEWDVLIATMIYAIVVWTWPQ